jgi:hypothetical protein
MEEKKTTRYKRSENLHVRTVGFPPDLYADLARIAKREDRDVTAQIIRMLRESLKHQSPENS